MENIRGNLFTRHPHNINHVHEGSNDPMSVIIILGTNVHGGETVFYDAENMKNIGKIANVLKHSHGRFVAGPLDKILHEGSIWTGHRVVLYFILHKSIFIHLVHHCTTFYDKYITSDDRNILMMMGVLFLQNKRLESNTMQNIKRLIQIDIMF